MPEPRVSSDQDIPVVSLAADVPRDVVRGVVRDGNGVRIRRGAYLLGTASPGPREHGRRRQVELARIGAVSRQLPGEHVFSHDSAALLWGLPLWQHPSSVHVVQRHVPGAGRARDVVRHRVPLEPDDVVRRSGLRVTSFERTVVDCVRSLPARDGLVVADAALRTGTTRETLLDRLERSTGRGLVRARSVLDVADDGAESPGESVARYVLLRHGLPRPQTQLAVRTRMGRFRADMGWPKWRLLLEFDGFVKYDELADRNPARVLFEEKRRQEAMEEEGWRFLRATSADLRDAAALPARLLRLIPPGSELALTPRPALH